VRYVLAGLLLASCAKPDPLVDDMKMVCRAVDVFHENQRASHTPLTQPTLADIGPWMEERAKTDDVKRVLARAKSGETALGEFVVGLRELAKKANVEPCPTLDAMYR
jgi:hypothetical protein